MKKAKKIIGITLIAIVIIGALLGILYLKTDVLNFIKSPRRLFFTYLIQNREGVPEFNYLDTMERIQKESYEENGVLEWNIQIADTNMNEQIGINIEEINNTKLLFNSKVDPKEGETAIDLDIKHREENLAKIQAVFTNNNIGIKIAEIFDKFLIIENNNIKEFVEKFGLDSTTIPDKIDFTKTIEFDTLTEEELKIIKETYTNVLNESISKDNYTRNKQVININGEDVKTNAYTLTLSEKEVQTLIINLMKAVKKDDVLLDCFVNNINKVNEANYEQGYEEIKKSDIKILLNYFIAAMEESQSNSNEKLELTVYENKGRTLRTQISIAESALVLDKEQKDNNTNFRLSIKEKENEIIVMAFNIIQGKDKNEINTSMNLEDMVMQLDFQVNKEMTEFNMDLLVEIPDVKINIKEFSKLEYKQVEIDEAAILENGEVLNQKTVQEIEEIFTDIEEDAIDFLENIKNRFIKE